MKLNVIECELVKLRDKIVGVKKDPKQSRRKKLFKWAICVTTLNILLSVYIAEHVYSITYVVQKDEKIWRNYSKPLSYSVL